MQAWHVKLSADFKQLNQEASMRVEAMRTHLKPMLETTKCSKCGIDTLNGDIVKFSCPCPSPQNGGTTTHTGKSVEPHAICFDCLGDRVERQRGYLERHPQAAQLKKYGALPYLTLCYVCHCPFFITERVVFESDFNQAQVRTRGRREFATHAALTAIAQEPNRYRVHTYYENQRRGMFSKFSCDNLSFADSRSATSDEADEPVDIAALDQQGDGRNGRLWMEDWTCDTKARVCDPQGWCYAVNWPTQRMFSWTISASFSTFVRRRRMMRTNILVDDKLLLAPDEFDKRAAASASASEQQQAPPQHTVVSMATVLSNLSTASQVLTNDSTTSRQSSQDRSGAGGLPSDGVLRMPDSPAPTAAPLYDENTALLSAAVPPPAVAAAQQQGAAPSVSGEQEPSPASDIHPLQTAAAVDA